MILLRWENIYDLLLQDVDGFGFCEENRVFGMMDILCEYKMMIWFDWFQILKYDDSGVLWLNID